MKHEAGRSTLVRCLYLGETLTGTGTTLLGCVLPSLIPIWHMSDAHAGLIFTAQFAGASFGALLVSRDYLGSVRWGYGLVVVSALSMALFANASQAFFFFLVLGLGLGLAMTATSMLAASMFPEGRASVLSLLNAYWGLGAVLCPIVAAWWVRRWRAESLFIALAAACTLVFVIAVSSSVPALRAPASAVEKARLPLYPILGFAVIAFLYCGVETSVSGWMMSYVHRLTVSPSPLPSIAASCFWVALLCGRAISPAVLRRVSEADLLAASTLAAFISLSLLVLNRVPFGIVVSAASAGFTLGPIYPLCLAKVLALAKDAPGAKWVFASAGLGGGIMPWLTGKLSTHNGSLRTGLTIPLFATGTMLVFLLWQMATERAKLPGE